MSLAYNLWTEEEVENRNVLPDGDYKFLINDIISKKTKGGLDKEGNEKPIRDMVEIDISIMYNGQQRNIKDWIVFMREMDWKFRHLADTTGLISLYESRQLDCVHLKNKGGTLKLGSKDMIMQDGTSKKINYVKDYIKGIANVEKQTSLDNDLPF